MTRLPFNFDNASTPKPKADPPPKDRPIRVADLAAQIATALKTGLPATLKVQGEISNLKRQTHLYLALKDSDAAISAVMFAPAARKLDFQPKDGDQVIATGRIDFWQRAGRTQLYIESMTPAGEGALLAKLRARTEELRALGYLDPTRKQPIPPIPRRVAVVTSLGSAALQDVLDTARRRCPAIDIITIDTRVQGDTAATQIAHAINAAAAQHQALAIDTLILTRGGGSTEDLWSFNERAVADAIHNCPIPIIAAIGHETDTTLAELVADHRAATPTQAAMLAIPDRADLQQQLDHIAARLHTSAARTTAAERRHLTQLTTRRTLSDHTQTLAAHAATLNTATQSTARAIQHALHARRRSLDSLAARLNRHRPEATYARREERLRSAAARLNRTTARALARAPHRTTTDDLAVATADALAQTRSRLNTLARELEIASPLRILARGFSVTTTSDGTLITNPSQTTPGQRITTRLAQGAMTSTVTDDAHNQQTPPAQQPEPLPKRTQSPHPARRRRKHHNPDQLGLF